MKNYQIKESDSNSPLLVCGENKSTELSLKGFNKIQIPVGIKLPFKIN